MYKWYNSYFVVFGNVVIFVISGFVFLIFIYMAILVYDFVTLTGVP